MGPVVPIGPKFTCSKEFLELEGGAGGTHGLLLGSAPGRVGWIAGAADVPWMPHGRTVAEEVSGAMDRPWIAWIASASKQGKSLLKERSTEIL